MTKFSWLVLVFFLLFGSSIGLGVFTFQYAEGFSYFSPRSEACINCHVMNQQFQSWQASGHHHVATCAQCHLPQSGLSKYVAKAENGWHHSLAFTFGNFKEPIQIGEKNRGILERNCRSCHSTFVSESAGKIFGHGSEQEFSCLHCHRKVGHFPRY